MVAMHIPNAVIDAVKAQLDEEEEDKKRAEALAARALLRKQRAEAKLWWNLGPVFEAHDKWHARHDSSLARYDVTTNVPLNTQARHEATVEAERRARDERDAGLQRARAAALHIPPPPPPRYDAVTGVPLNPRARREAARLEGGGWGLTAAEAMALELDPDDCEPVTPAGEAARDRRMELEEARQQRRAVEEAAEQARRDAERLEWEEPTDWQLAHPWVPRAMHGQRKVDKVGFAHYDHSVARWDKKTGVALNVAARVSDAQGRNPFAERKPPEKPRFDPKTGVPLNREARFEVKLQNDGREWIIA